MTDPIAAKRFDFAIQNDAGEVKPAAIILPASLTWEELHAVRDAVSRIGQQVVQEAFGPKLVLMKAPLPKAPNV